MLKFTACTSPLRSASSTSSADSLEVVASGFSHTTCLPASIAAFACSWWRWFGEVMCTTSTRGSSSIAWKLAYTGGRPSSRDPTAAPISVAGFTTCLILAETVGPLRLLQVGLGGWGRDWAWRVMPEVPEVEVAGYVDSDPGSLKLLQQEVPGAADRCFATLREAIAKTEAEAVLVTATLDGHAPVTRAAVDAGLHVLVEKPFAADVKTAEELVSAAASNGVALMVSQNYRFFPAVRTVARLIQEQALGKLAEVSIDFRRFSGVSTTVRARHHGDEQPLLVDMSIHHFDLLRMLLNREPDRIYCESWNPAWSAFAGPAVAVATVVFGDIVVSYRGSWVSA